jgi:cell division cycle protein 20 (cofactor of APC complex)
MDLDLAHFNLTQGENENPCKGVGAIVGDEPTAQEQEFNKALTSGMTGNDDTNGARVLAFKNKAPQPEDGYANSLKVLYSQNKGSKSKSGRKLNRAIADAPSRILDAPDLIDDYYFNLISWSSQNTLAVALGSAVYLWNAETGGIEELLNTEDDDCDITSVSFIKEGGGHLAIGMGDSTVQLWDCAAMKRVRSMDGHSARVSSLAWNPDQGHLLSSGSRDSVVVNHDVRQRAHNVAQLVGHEQEVCGLSWSHDGKTLASGGNDNMLCLWDATASGAAQPRFKLTDHCAAVKALAWCPFERNVLASGGGTADRSIKFWNAQNGALLNSVDTGSQVCSLLWSQTEKELLSSHGFSQNQLTLWNYPTMTKLKELKGHTARVLHMAASPNGTTVVSAAADETLRFWDVFSAPSSKNADRGIVQKSSLMSSMRRIR